MRAGELRDRVRIKSDTSAANTNEPSYTDIRVNEPARITEVSAGEKYRGRQLEAHVKAVILMRYRSTVNERCQIVGQTYPFEGKTYNIEGIKIVRNGSRPVGLELECST